MASNLYAKTYRTEPRMPKNEEIAFISYTDEPNSFSVVSVKRLFDVDKFRKGFIREKNKNYRIVIIERTGRHTLYISKFVRYLISLQGALTEMEQLAKETEEASSYTMNNDVVSDTEEWHKRQRSFTNKHQGQISRFLREFIVCTDICSCPFER